MVKSLAQSSENLVGSSSLRREDVQFEMEMNISDLEEEVAAAEADKEPQSPLREEEGGGSDVDPLVVFDNVRNQSVVGIQNLNHSGLVGEQAGPVDLRSDLGHEVTRTVSNLSLEPGVLERAFSGEPGQVQEGVAGSSGHDPRSRARDPFNDAHGHHRGMAEIRAGGCDPATAVLLDNIRGSEEREYSARPGQVQTR